MAAGYDTEITRPPLGGYDLEIFVDKDKIGEYICQICHDVSRDCVEVSCGNGHIFCNSCIRYNFKINGHSCPADRTKNITITANDFVRRKILASNVKCQYHTFSCQWIGALRQLDHHVSHCKYKPIKCKYCHDSISSQMVNEHYAECDEFLVRCSWCNNMYRRKMLNEHIDSCYMKPIICPNGCNERVIKNKLNIHLSDQCPERMIHCSFNKFGCNETIKFRHINQHNSDNILQHIQYQMKWILLENENKNKQILQLKSHILQLEAPDFIVVEGSIINEMNGIYKKHMNTMDQKCAVRRSQYNSPHMEENNTIVCIENIEDEKKEYIYEDMQNNIISIGNISNRSFYKKYDATEWILYYNERRNEWVFSSHGFNLDNMNNIQFDGCCNDSAFTPLHISNNIWKIWMDKENKYEIIHSIKISEIDLLQQLLNKENTKTNKISYSAPQGPLFHVDETKTAVLNPSFIPSDDDKSDQELAAPTDNSNNNNRRSRIRTLSNTSDASNISNVSEADSESSHHSRSDNDNRNKKRGKIPIRVTINDNNNNGIVSHNNMTDKWSISVSIKTKYDQLYDDLLRRESNRNHHNPFGPPMVSNQTLYRYLTSVAYDSHLIKILWKLINNSPTHSNINNLLTRNGFVAICHLLDKITNNNYKIPNELPVSLQPQSLNNLISTPVHNERLNNTVFPNIENNNNNRFDKNNGNNNTQQNIEIVANNIQSGSLLTFNTMNTSSNDTTIKPITNEHALSLEDVFEFNEMVSEEKEESKQDFLLFTPTAKTNAKANMLLMTSETGSTPNPSIINNMPPITMMDFMNSNHRSKTKPNTPIGNDENQNVFLNVFPPQMLKSKSLDDHKNNYIKSKSSNDIFNIPPTSISPNRSANTTSNNQHRRQRNMNNNNNNNNIKSNNNTPTFGSNTAPRNGLDDLWDESWQSSMNNNKK